MVGSKGYNYLHESQTLEGGYEKILWKMYKIHRTDLPVYAIHKDASSKHGPQLSSLTKLRMAWPSPYTIRSLFDDRDGAAGRRGLHRGASRKKATGLVPLWPHAMFLARSGWALGLGLCSRLHFVVV